MKKIMYLLVILCCCVLPASSNRNTDNRLPCPVQQKIQQAQSAVAEEIDFLPMHNAMGHI